METITFIFSFGKLVFWLSKPSIEQAGKWAFSELFGEEEAIKLGKRVQEALSNPQKISGDLYYSEIKLTKDQIKKFKELGNNSPIAIENREDTLCARLVYPRPMS